jgi:hypothetical protein
MNLTDTAVVCFTENNTVELPVTVLSSEVV